MIATAQYYFPRIQMGDGVLEMDRFQTWYVIKEEHERPMNFIPLEVRTTTGKDLDKVMLLVSHQTLKGKPKSHLKSQDPSV